MFKTLAVCLMISPCVAFADTWLKGDLHVHTHYSGGDSTVLTLAETARALGLDFIAVTDHDDKMNGLPLHWDEITRASTKTATTLLYGMEWTHGINWVTCKGHMNLWSDHPYDYREIWQANLDANPDRAEALAMAEGAVFSINHPKLFGFEWKFDFPDSLPAMEIWNGTFVGSSSRKTIGEVWGDYYRRGIRVTGVGGSDTHFLNGRRSRVTTLGNPTTWVYSNSNSATSVLKGIKKGRVLITFAPNAPAVLIKADRDLDGDYESLPGDNLAIDGSVASFEIDILGTAGKSSEKSVVLYKNGKRYKVWDVTHKTSLRFRDRIRAGERAWYFVELRGKTGLTGPKAALYGNMLSISNPITLNF